MALQALAAADAMKARANSGEIISTVLLWELQQKGARMMPTLKKAGHRGGASSSATPTAQKPVNLGLAGPTTSDNEVGCML